MEPISSIKKLPPWSPFIHSRFLPENGHEYASFHQSQNEVQQGSHPECGHASQWYDGPWDHPHKEIWLCAAWSHLQCSTPDHYTKLETKWHWVLWHRLHIFPISILGNVTLTKEMGLPATLTSTIHWLLENCLNCRVLLPIRIIIRNQVDKRATQIKKLISLLGQFVHDPIASWLHHCSKCNKGQSMIHFLLTYNVNLTCKSYCRTVSVSGQGWWVQEMAQ